jgi:UDP-N-acetylmuramoylalanine--D-glutamate ligase
MTARIYDEQPEGAIAKRELISEAVSAGIELSLGWDGDFVERPDLLVVNPAIPFAHPRVLAAIAEGIEVVGEIEFAYRLSRAPIVAITGSNGKSTTTVMAYLALRGAGVDAKLCGNIYGSGFDEIPLTEAAMNSTSEQILVAEVSSFQLERVKEFRPVAAAITNIVPEHADRVSWEDYVASKHRIFAAQGAGDYAVVRANDPVVVPPGGARLEYQARGKRQREAAAEPSKVAVLTFGATGEHARIEEDAIVFFGRSVSRREFQFTEPHNMLNAACAGLLACSALAVVRGGSPAQYVDAMLPGLLEFRFIAHRMEPVGERGGIRVINNSMCTNPDAVVASAQAVRDPVHLLMGGVNKGLDFRRLKHYLANGRNRAYLFGRDAEELNKMLGGNLPIFDTMKDAFDVATERAVSGEVIMLAPGCASSDQFRDFRDRGEVFKDMAKEWLTIDGTN